MTKPGQGPRPSVHQAEVIEYVKGLGADRVALTGDQISLLHLDRGYPLLGDQRLDASLAQAWITAQVGVALQGASQKPCPQPPR